MGRPMSRQAEILSIGEMDIGVDEALAERFRVYRDSTLGLETIVAEHGGAIAAIVTRGRTPTTAALIRRLPNLELIANFAVGLLLATVRRLPQADRHVRGKRWACGESFPLGPSLRGRRVGIAGMGRVGKVIARRLDGFDVPIAYHARNQQPALPYPYPYHTDLHALARAVDVLIVALPGGVATRRVINAEVLEALGPNGILINVARGSVVDEPALVDALRAGTILAAGLDVFAEEPHVPEELLEMENVVLLPHVGTATHHTRGLMRQMVIDNVVSWFDGRGALTPVPETPQVVARSGP